MYKYIFICIIFNDFKSLLYNYSVYNSTVIIQYAILNIIIILNNIWIYIYIVRIVDCLVCVLLPMCSLWPSFSLTLIFELIQVCLVFIPKCLCI